MLDLGDVYDQHVWRVYAFFAYRLNSREDAEDLTQATFERALRAAGRYDERKGNELTWLMAISQNLLIDHFRRAAAARTRPAADLEDLAGPAPTDEQHGVGIAPELAAALTLLSEREREIVALRYGADLTNREIAELKGLTLANVQQILSRSLRRMRTAIDGETARATER